MTRLVRVWLPAAVVAGGIAAIVLGPESARWEGGMGIVGAGLAIWLLNAFFRIGVAGDVEREREEAARAYFDRHGRWPDE